MPALRAYVNARGDVILPTMPEYVPHRGKQAGQGENFAEDDPRLPELEQQAVNALLDRWRWLRRRTLEVLGLPPGKAPQQVYRFDPTHVAELLDLEARFVADAAGERSTYARRVYQAWLRGATNAANELGADVLADSIRMQARQQLVTRGLELVRNGAIRRFRRGILQQLQEGIYDGLNPRDVARKLRARFGAGDYNWERLARSEITQAQVGGKAEQYAEEGVTEYDYVTSGDSKVSAICRSNAAGNPHPLATGPRPVRDSHPNCRCTIVAREPGE